MIASIRCKIGQVEDMRGCTRMKEREEGIRNGRHGHLMASESTTNTIGICRLRRAILTAWQRVELRKGGREERGSWGSYSG
jgi:hypothetical protein